MADPDKQRENSTVPGRNGGKLRRGGQIGNKGGTGRPPKTFATFLKSLREDEDVQAAMKQAASDPNSRGYGAVIRTLTDYDDEKPAEKKQLSGELVVRVKRDP